jgi:3-oxoacyl-[acyl-carrier-protein] synthase II
MVKGAVIIGVGVVTPFGDGLQHTFDTMLAGRCAVGPLTRFDARTFPVRIAAEVPWGEGAAPRLTRSWLDRALDEALTGVDLGRVPPDRIGVFVGAEAARPDLDAVARLMGSRAPGDDGTLDPAGDPWEVVRAHAPWGLTSYVADRVGATGPRATLSTACTSSAQAVGEALLALRRGEIDVAVAAGADALVHPLMLIGFARLGALSTRNADPQSASRPFDVDRDGFVLGEGAGVMVLARAEVAEAIGPRIGRLLGYGCSSNAWRITDSPPDGRGAYAAMRAALADACVRVDEVSTINAHGTGTRQNDQSEARGIRSLFGDRADTVAVHSSKGALGHLVAACGVVEAAIALESVRRRVVPATRNLENPDPECAIGHVVGAPRSIVSGVAVSNAFGFGGANASLVVAAP